MDQSYLRHHSSYHGSSLVIRLQRVAIIVSLLMKSGLGSSGGH